MPDLMHIPCSAGQELVDSLKTLRPVRCTDIKSRKYFDEGRRNTFNQHNIGRGTPTWRGPAKDESVAPQGVKWTGNRPLGKAPDYATAAPRYCRAKSRGEPGLSVSGRDWGHPGTDALVIKTHHHR
jgi:hypothetical protein